MSFFLQGAFSDGNTQCEKICVALTSPVGRIEIYGCEIGVHEIKLQGKAMLQNGYVSPLTDDYFLQFMYLRYQCFDTIIKM